MAGRLGWAAAPTADAAVWLAPYDYPPWGPGQPGLFSGTHTHVLRILHPTWNQDEDGITEVTWAQIAAARGITVEDGAMLQDIAGDNSPDPALDGVFDTAYWVGTLPPDLLGPLLTHLPDARDGLMWEGWTDLHNGEVWDAVVAADARVQGRRGAQRYFPVTLVDAATTPAITFRTPALWWAPDHSWVAVSGIDDFDTVIVSPDWALLEPIHHDPRFETQLYTQEPRHDQHDRG